MMIPDLMSMPILAVDDEPTNLKLLQKMLGMEGYTDLVLLDKPSEVVEAYRRHRPGLILLDINMPQMDGYKVMAALKALEDPMLPPIIVLTAQSSQEFMLRAFKAGARDYVTKPFERAELMARVRNLLEACMAQRMAFEHRKMLQEMVRERTAKLHRTRLQVVRRLGRAAEYRDNETGNHILRMSKISALLAQRIGWCEEDCELMLHASPMHDIGKIGVPDHILLKPGKLTPEEWEIMKTHVDIGAEILADSDTDLLVLGRSIALSHHEKWDGTGYPNGLAGEAIPMEGRIAAMADVFDALTSVRPYKKAWPVEDAVAYVKDQSGRQFDPSLVPVFVDSLPEIMRIRAEHPES